MLITDMETKVMEAFVKDDFCENGLDSCLWCDVFLSTVEGYAGINSKQARGVLSSLVKKGLIYGMAENHRRDSMGRREEVVRLTESGKEFMHNLGYDENGEKVKQPPRLVPIPCRYRTGKKCGLPPMMTCPHYQAGATWKDQATCGAVKD